MRNLSSRKPGCFLLAFSLVFIWHSCIKDQKIYINENDFYDKVYACWLGKNIGGTLGMPFEGDTNIHDINFYTKLKEGEPAANDDLDLQILWLKAMQENDAHVDAFTLGEYWLKYVPVNWNEYGVGKANMRAGLKPPVSGEFNNDRWKHSNGAWIRSEIWACLFPGNPMMAVEMAREDACVDHGMAEGTYAEIFTASIESAAFIESDRDSLISFGMSMIPPDCRVAKAVGTAVQAKKEGKDWKEARMAVIKNTKNMGWFQAPRNVAFTMIGWLYGEGDFGKSICIAVNCGDDTDCTGATLGSIFGIIGGTKAIPEKWRKPVGNKISTVAITGFKAPATLDVLTDSTVKMTKKVLSKYNLPVMIGPDKSNLPYQKQSMKPDKNELEKLWNLSPWRVVRHNTDWVIIFDYLQEPFIQEDMVRKLAVSVSNVAGNKELYKLSITGLPEKWEVSGLPADTFGVEKGGKKTLDISILANSISSDTIQLSLLLTRGADSDAIPFTLFRKKI
ncbi:MAG: ADP-ribosylglycohydrolase family protein [Bacteroidales bacterium]|nr:ADP-ribosylglycohydrolase family protein [Bacteroidales bacterium]